MMILATVDTAEGQDERGHTLSAFSDYFYQRHLNLLLYGDTRGDPLVGMHDALAAAVKADAPDLCPECGAYWACDCRPVDCPPPSSGRVSIDGQVVGDLGAPLDASDITWAPASGSLDSVARMGGHAVPLHGPDPWGATWGTGVRARLIAKAVTYRCGRCDYTAPDLGALWDHFSAAGHQPA